MAVGHVTFSRNTAHGFILGKAFEDLQNALNGLAAIRSVMVQMADGTDYAYAVTKFGFPDEMTAEAAFNELDSLYAKLTTDAQVTNVKAAIDQALARFRN